MSSTGLHWCLQIWKYNNVRFITMLINNVILHNLNFEHTWNNFFREISNLTFSYNRNLLHFHYNHSYIYQLFSYVFCSLKWFTGIYIFNRYGADPASTLLEDVDCYSSSYLVLLQCSYSSQYSTYCNINIRDAFVACCK